MLVERIQVRLSTVILTASDDAVVVDRAMSRCMDVHPRLLFILSIHPDPTGHCWGQNTPLCGDRCFRGRH